MNRLLSPSTAGMFGPMRHNTTSAQTPITMIIIVPCKQSDRHISCEEDSDGISIYRDEIDPDDMTNYGYYHRHHSRKTWSPPGYGDDD